MTGVPGFSSNPKHKMGLPFWGQLLKCNKGCGKKILVEYSVGSGPHDTVILATHWDCLDKKTQKKAKEIYELE